MTKKSVKKNLYGESLVQVIDIKEIKPETIAKAVGMTINDVLQWMYKDRSKIKEETMELLCQCLDIKEAILTSPKRQTLIDYDNRTINDINREVVETGKHYGDISAQSRLAQTKIVRKLQA